VVSVRMGAKMRSFRGSLRVSTRTGRSGLEEIRAKGFSHIMNLQKVELPVGGSSGFATLASLVGENALVILPRSTGTRCSRCSVKQLMRCLLSCFKFEMSASKVPRKYRKLLGVQDGEFNIDQPRNVHILPPAYPH
jgi:hypothetical protein